MTGRRPDPDAQRRVLEAKIERLEDELAAVRTLEGLWILKTLRRPEVRRALSAARAALRSRLATMLREPRLATSKATRLFGRLARKALASDAPRIELRPLAPAAAAARAAGGRRLICVSHILPHPPRAGNEVRLLRMLKWLVAQGWDILLVVCPLVGDDVDTGAALALAAEFPNVVVCRHDGVVVHRLAFADHGLPTLEGRRPRRFARRLGENDGRGPSRHAVDLQRSFCPDVLVEVVLHLEARFAPEVLLAEYVFMTRPFRLLRPSVRKVIDTIDVFSNKADKVEAYGVADALALSEADEAALLGRADLLIAIQSEEAADLRRLAPRVPVVEVGVDFIVPERVRPPAAAPNILLVASANPLNVKGLRDFLRFAWPIVRREVPEAELRVVGSVGGSLDAPCPGVQVLGVVRDLALAYADARVVINPAVAGTGLKIKTVEALCHGRPIVVWPSGVEGIDPEMQAGCHVATNWFDFALRLIGVLANEDALPSNRDDWIGRASAAAVYAVLDAALGAP
jgi:glycosyltransferase involved in cell wall biosynthesis